MAVRDRLAQIKADPRDWDWDEWVLSENDEKAVLAGHRPVVDKADHVCDFFEEYLRLSAAGGRQALSAVWRDPPERRLQQELGLNRPRSFVIPGTGQPQWLSMSTRPLM